MEEVTETSSSSLPSSSEERGSSKSSLFSGEEGVSFFLVSKESIENLREFEPSTCIWFPVDVMLDEVGLLFLRFLFLVSSLILEEALQETDETGDEAGDEVVEDAEETRLIIIDL